MSYKIVIIQGIRVKKSSFFLKKNIYQPIPSCSVLNKT